MQQVREGDVGKLELLFDRHHRALFGYFLHLSGNRTTSEDLVQEAFFRVLKYRHTYQPALPFRAWIYQIARTLYMDHSNRHKAEVALPEEATEITDQSVLPDRQAQNREDAMLLRRALAALPREKREVLIMSRFQDLKYDEIASALRIEVGTVKVRVYRALRDLTERYFAMRGERAS